ncbi:hypothetical protein PCC7424_5015 [Gloeothece citriformis PCC 7424]|uniref:Uncharacterized protein n=2 Tax=Gloeothece TaxID=28070 RepID=B7KFP3_GLOC7|nr:hypothetical protein PCC7424_5015 [Gloeothece citriformis PCC 7424]
MRIKNEAKKSWDIHLMPSNQKDINLNINIYMSKEVAERLVIILLSCLVGMPLSFLTAWYVSNQVLSSLPLEIDKVDQSWNFKDNNN